jgi:hypothetical protein
MLYCFEHGPAQTGMTPSQRSDTDRVGEKSFSAPRRTHPGLKSLQFHMDSQNRSMQGTEASSAIAEMGSVVGRRSILQPDLPGDDVVQRITPQHHRKRQDHEL